MSLTLHENTIFGGPRALTGMTRMAQHLARAELYTSNILVVRSGWRNKVPLKSFERRSTREDSEEASAAAIRTETHVVETHRNEPNQSDHNIGPAYQTELNAT